MYTSRSSFSPFDNKAKTAIPKSNNAASGSTLAGNNTTTATTNNNINNSHVSTVEPFFRFDANDHHAFVEVELPGVTKPDVSVELNGHVMTITAMRYRSTHLLMLRDWSRHHNDSNDDNATATDNNDHEDGGENGDGNVDEHATDQEEEEQHRQNQKETNQQRVPSFLYSLEMRLASAADVENITCLHFRDGVLTIRIPARRKILPRFLPIP